MTSVLVAGLGAQLTNQLDRVQCTVDRLPVGTIMESENSHFVVRLRHLLE